MKRMMVLVLVVLSSAMVFAGGQEEADSSVSVMFQGGEPEVAAVTAALERFTAATGIEVEPLYTPHNVYSERLAGYINSGNMPDVLQFDGPGLFNYVWSGHVAPIAGHITAGAIDDMTASSIAMTTYPLDGELYAASHQDSTVLLYGNRSYLEKVGARIPTSIDDPWTGEEFNRILADLAELDEVTWPLDIMAAYGTRTEWATFGFSPIVQSFGADLINRTTWQADGTINSRAAISALEMVQRWNENGWIVPASAGDNQLFNEDRAAALAWSGHWFWPAAYDALGDDLVAIPLPDFGTGAVSPNGSWVWTISEASEKKDLAGQLISFLLSDEEFLADLRDLAVFPGLKSFLAMSDVFTDPDRMAIASAQSATAVSRPPHPAYPVITQAFFTAFDDILGGADVKRALDNAAAAIDEDIADNEGYPPFGN